MSSAKRDLIYRNGRPAAVIIGIREYEELLERLEDVEDVMYLRKLRQKPLHFTRLSDFLSQQTKSRRGRGNGRRSAR